MATAFEELGISREDILDRAAEKVLEGTEDSEDICQSVKKEVVKTLLSQAGPKIDTILSESLSGLVDEEYTPIDEWGRPTQPATSLRKLIQDRATGYLKEKVDKDGKASVYGCVGTRGEWFARKAVADALTYEVKKDISVAVESAKAGIRQKIAEYITEQMLKK